VHVHLYNPPYLGAAASVSIRQQILKRVTALVTRNDVQDEVRALGRLPAMGVPENFVARHPFPGPGLAVRVLGDVTAADHLTVLREVRLAACRHFPSCSGLHQAPTQCGSTNRNSISSFGTHGWVLAVHACLLHPAHSLSNPLLAAWTRACRSM